jgi:alkaline phosphatase D
MHRCVGLILALASASLGRSEDAPTPHQASGTRVGEMTDSTAVVWTRLTANGERNRTGQRFDESTRAAAEVKGAVDDLHGACPGMDGRVRLRYGTKEDLSDAVATAWVDVSDKTDFIHQFRLAQLKAGTTYHYASEAADRNGKPSPDSARGRFRTAPAAAAPTDLTFCVMTCQGYKDRGNPDGHAIYPAMGKLNPAFAVLTGDLVYYDNDPPKAVSPRLARYHWERMFSLPRLRSFTASTGTYWLKDDHDLLANDTWPGKKSGAFTFRQGQEIFRQQAPIADGPSYRTVRWGRDLQIWFTDGRDARSPNSLPDGPGKTIWGQEQKAWFQKTVRESTARWKVLVSPTPIVGPDRTGKNDNHSNAGFRHEGDEIRAWLKAHAPGLVVVCGDRHWQYHSVHPETGLNEFSVGPASDEHAGGTPGENKAVHRFHRVKGGFLSITVRPVETGSRARFDLHDVDGGVKYSWICP